MIPMGILEIENAILTPGNSVVKEILLLIFKNKRFKANKVKC